MSLQWNSGSENRVQSISKYLTMWRQARQSVSLLTGQPGVEEAERAVSPLQLACNPSCLLTVTLFSGISSADTEICRQNVARAYRVAY